MVTEPETEQGFSPSEKDPGVRAAHVLSVIFNPLLVLLPAALLICLKTAPDLGRALLWWAIILHRGLIMPSHSKLRSPSA